MAESCMIFSVESEKYLSFLECWDFPLQIGFSEENLIDCEINVWQRDEKSSFSNSVKQKSINIRPRNVSRCVSQRIFTDQMIQSVHAPLDIRTILLYFPILLLEGRVNYLKQMFNEATITHILLWNAKMSTVFSVNFHSEANWPGSFEHEPIVPQTH